MERFRCPEILFHPNLIGIEQAGLDEMTGVAIQRLQSKTQRLEESNSLTNSVLITGGSCLYPGMSERLEAGIRMIRPSGTPIRVLRASDAVLDAWLGAASFASTAHFQRQAFNKKDYYEKGEDWLRQYQLKYSF